MMIPMQAISAQWAVTEAMKNPNRSLVEKAKLLLHGLHPLRIMQKFCEEGYGLSVAVAAVKTAEKEIQ